MSKPAATRRWPDILIGVLVLLLLGGFAALLLGQRRTATTTTPTATAPATSSIPAAPGTAENTATPNTETPEITPPVEAAADTTETDTTAAGSTETGNAATPADTAPATPSTDPTADATAEAPIIPAAPTDSAATTPQTTPDTATGTDAQPVETPTAETPTPTTETPQAQITDTPVTPAETPATAVAPRSGGAVATSESRTPLRSDYRISLGTFGSVGTAQSRTAPVSSLGYRVYPIDLGNQVVAQVGPFADEASARQALGDIVRAYPGALLYPPRAAASRTPSTPEPENTSSASRAPATSAPASGSGAGPADAPAPAGPIYLQVGAFDRVESAQKLVDELRDLGYVPTVNAPEGRKVTVAVGPYTGDALTRTEKRLDDNNLDHFRVR